MFYLLYLKHTLYFDCLQKKLFKVTFYLLYLIIYKFPRTYHLLTTSWDKEDIEIKKSHLIMVTLHYFLKCINSPGDSRGRVYCSNLTDVEVIKMKKSEK